VRKDNRRHASSVPPVPPSADPIPAESPGKTQLTDPRVREKQILEILEARVARSAFLNIDIFHDPAWDMLLALFAANLGGRRLDVGRLCVASGVPASTAIRYLNCLSEEGLLRPDETDEGAHVQLSNRGIAAMESYFDYLNSGKFAEVISAPRH
jgi:predicted transcriptional regulator